jgi:hypothetical protein
VEPILSDDTAAMNASNAAAEQTNDAANAAALQTEKSRSRSKESDRTGKPPAAVSAVTPASVRSVD